MLERPFDSPLSDAERKYLRFLAAQRSQQNLDFFIFCGFLIFYILLMLLSVETRTRSAEDSFVFLGLHLAAITALALLAIRPSRSSRSENDTVSVSLIEGPFRYLGNQDRGGFRPFVGSYAVDIPHHWSQEMKKRGMVRCRVTHMQKLFHAPYVVLAIEGGPSIDFEARQGLGQARPFPVLLIAAIVLLSSAIIAFPAILARTENFEKSWYALTGMLNEAQFYEDGDRLASAVETAPILGEVTVMSGWVVPVTILETETSGYLYALLSTKGAERLRAQREKAEEVILAQQRQYSRAFAAWRERDAQLRRRQQRLQKAFEENDWDTINPILRSRLREGWNKRNTSPKRPLGPSYRPVSGDILAFLHNATVSRTPKQITAPHHAPGDIYDPILETLSRPQKIHGFALPARAGGAERLRIEKLQTMEDHRHQALWIIGSGWALLVVFLLLFRARRILIDRRNFRLRVREAYRSAGMELAR